MLASFLWPVTAHLRWASIFSPPRTVTVVALMQWLVKCREMPALDVIFFIISARDLSPSEEWQNQIGCTQDQTLRYQALVVSGRRSQSPDLNEGGNSSRS